MIMTDNVTIAEILSLIASLDWCEMDESDYSCYAGVESEGKIAEDEELELVYILDNNRLSIFDANGAERTFHLGVLKEHHWPHQTQNYVG